MSDLPSGGGVSSQNVLGMLQSLVRAVQQLGQYTKDLAPVAASKATLNGTVANPGSTISTTGVMMGLGQSLTPVYSGNVVIVICGNAANSIAGDGAAVQIRTGTATAPGNGGVLAGISHNSTPTLTSATAGQTVGFALATLVNGLTLNTTMWIDVSLAAVTGGTASIGNISIVAYEV